MNLTSTAGVAPDEILEVYRAAEGVRRTRHLAGPLPLVSPRIGVDPRGLRKA